uniref:Uncharacterized protein n=1 Tax=Strongyloides venezuelensis TaxID=75913 RepID=A0A0K0FEQ7_STRVS
MLLIEFLKTIRMNIQISSYEQNFLLKYITVINGFVIKNEINFFNKITGNQKVIIDDTLSKQTSFASNDDVIKFIKAKSHSFGESVEYIFNKFIQKQFELLPENERFVSFLFKNSSNLLISIPTYPDFEAVKSFLLKFFLKYNDLSRESKKQLNLLYPNINQLIYNRKFNNLIVKFIQLSD